MIKLIVIFPLIAVFAALGYFYIMRPIVSEENYAAINTYQEPIQYPLFDFRNN